MMEGLNIDIRLIFAILNGKVSAAITRKLMDNFAAAEIPITPDQWSIMMHLDQRNGVTQQELCNAIYKQKPSMTRLIDIMEAHGLVSRHVNVHDRRKNTIYMTLLGKEMLRKSQKTALVTLKDALQGLALEDLRTAQEVLRQIFINTTHAEDSSLL